MKKTAIILFNLGGPDNLESVKPFLFNLFNDKAIINLPQPLRWVIAKVISAKRAPVAKIIYSKLGGASPLLINTKKQAIALEIALSKLLPFEELKCFIAMRYWHPMMEKVVSGVKEWGAGEVILLPLYPQFSVTTSGSSIKAWKTAAKNANFHVVTRTICCYPTNQGFVESIASRIESKIKSFHKTNNIRLLFTAHGLPKKIVDSGDPYQWAIEQTALSVVEILGIPSLDWVICYQSRVGPLKWIEPYTEDEILRAGEQRKSVIIVPIAFVSEHSETLVELDIEYRELAKQSGVPKYIRIGTVSCDGVFVNGLAEVIVEAKKESPRVLGPKGKRLCPRSWNKCLSGG